MARILTKTSEVLERPAEVAVAVIALLGLPKVLMHVAFDEHPVYLAGLVVLGAAHVLVALDCLWARRLGWVVLAVAALGTILVVAGQVMDPRPDGHWHSDGWFGPLLAHALLLDRQRRQRWLLVAVGVVAVVTLASVKELDVVEQVFGVLFTASGLGVLLVAKPIVRVMAEDYLASRRQRAETEQGEDEASARAEALAALRREMHDSLLHALQRIAAPWSVATPDEIRESCRDARTRLTQVPAPVTADHPVDVCAALEAALPSARHQLTCLPEQLWIPHAVAHAITSATREAVRNALKHTARTPRVNLSQRGEAVHVSVADDGPGFDVAKHRQHSLGLEGSIARPMTVVGGDARWHSGAGGTTVELVWPAPVPVPGVLGERARRLVPWLPLPIVVTTLLHVIVREWDGVWTQVLAVLLVSLLVVAGAMRVRRAGRLAPWAGVVLCGAAVALNVHNYVHLEEGSTGWDLWAPGLVAGALVVALVGQRVWVAVSLAVVVGLASLATSLATVGIEGTLRTHFGGLLAVLLYAVVTLVLVFSAGGVSRHLHATRRMAANAALRSQAARVRDGIWVEWLAHADEMTGGFLDDVAECRRDPTAPETREEAARLGSRLRDELRLWPGPLGVARELDRLRGLGWDARLLAGEVSRELDGELTELLGHVGGPPPSEAPRLSVTAESARATVTATPALRLEDHPALGRWVGIDDPDFTQLRTPGRGSDGS